MEMKKFKFCSIEKLPKFRLDLTKPLADLNAKVIASDQWKHQGQGLGFRV